MKIASRFLLPLEMYSSAALFAWGISGWMGGGTLWEVLAARGENLAWGLVIVSTGLAQFAICALEWFYGRRWNDAALLRSVAARGFAAFLACSVWVYVCYMLAVTPGIHVVFSMLLQAPLGVVFMAWALWENRKVQCLLDPAVPTSRLEHTIIDEREHLLRR